MKSRETTACGEPVESLTLYGLQIGFEPKVGALVELAGDTTWLSWDETVELAEWLVARVRGCEPSP